MRRQRDPIVVERELPAPPREAFAAWGDPESLALWMCPEEGMRPASVDVDFRVGGRFRIVMHGDRDYAHHGEYLEIDPPHRLVFTWISEFAPEQERRTRVSVAFEPVGRDRTRCTLVHDELPESPTYDGHPRGWRRILELLAARLAAP